MLKKYESPELEVIELENRDVIVSSDLDGDNGVNPGDWQKPFNFARPCSASQAGPCDDSQFDESSEGGRFASALRLFADFH